MIVELPLTLISEMAPLASMMMNVLCVLVVLSAESKRSLNVVELTSITFAIILMVA